MLKAVRISALLLVFSGSAYAGEVLTPPAPQPPANTVQEQTTDGDISTMSADNLAQTALDLLAVLPSLL